MANTPIKDTWKIETAYNEGGEKLSFRTKVDSIIFDDSGMTLDDWLKSMKALLKEEIMKELETTGIGGSLGETTRKTYTSKTVEFTVVSEDDNTEDKVKNITDWYQNSPAVTPEKPYLWKKETTEVFYRDNGESAGDPTINYYPCGQLNSDFVDTEWKEWIFKWDARDAKNTLLVQLRNAESDANFLKNDYTPSGWNDDMTERDVHTNYVQWCASRYKKLGVWGPFENLHIYGDLPRKGMTNNIYAVTPEIDEDLWDDDKEVLEKSLSFNVDSGKIEGIPDEAVLNYKWKDDCPNYKSGDVIYLASCYFSDNTLVGIDFPIRITGEAGVGSDGNEVEFAYCTSDKSDGSTLPEIVGQKYHLYTAEIADLNGWYDNAGMVGITQDRPYQFLVSRRGHYHNEDDWIWYNGNSRWGVGPDADIDINTVGSEQLAAWNYGWSKPALWSSWGNDGIDGDGVLYVYLRLTEEEYNFVKGHPERWNFDGGIKDYDPNDTTDPNHPNNPNNLTYEIKILEDECKIDYLIEWDAKYFVATDIPVTWTIYNGNHTLLGETVSTTVYVTIATPEGEVNDSYDNPKYYILKSDVTFYNGLPKPVTLNMTFYYTRDKKDQTSYTYNVFYKLEGTETLILELGEAAHIIGSLQKNETKTVEAPKIPGYTVSGIKESVITKDNPTVTFYYTKE